MRLKKSMESFNSLKSQFVRRIQEKIHLQWEEINLFKANRRTNPAQFRKIS